MNPALTFISLSLLFAESNNFWDPTTSHILSSSPCKVINGHSISPCFFWIVSIELKKHSPHLKICTIWYLFVARISLIVRLNWWLANENWKMNVVHVSTMQPKTLANTSYFCKMLVTNSVLMARRRVDISGTVSFPPRYIYPIYIPTLIFLSFKNFPLLCSGAECCLSIPFCDVMHPYFRTFCYVTQHKRCIRVWF